MKVWLFAAALVTAVAAQASPTIESRYNSSCGICHTNGAGGVPKTHDVAAWQPRLEKGMDKMIESIQNGYRGMPPKGMCFDCSEEEFEALVKYMASPES